VRRRLTVRKVALQLRLQLLRINHPADQLHVVLWIVFIHGTPMQSMEQLISQHDVRCVRWLRFNTPFAGLIDPSESASNCTRKTRSRFTSNVAAICAHAKIVHSRYKTLSGR
jgi:hypothetical protein